MVEYTIQDNLHSMLMKAFAYVCEVLVGAKPAVDLFEVTGVIAVIVGFEDWVQQDRVHAKIAKIFGPVQ